MRELAPAWPPVATRVERDGVEPFRRAVDRGGQPGRPAADDDEVEHVARHRAEREPEVLGELARRRVAQHAGRRDHDGRVRRPEAHVGEQHVDVVVVLEVDPRVREARTGRRTRAAPSPRREYREPMIRTARAPSPARRSSRRATNAEKIVSARSGLLLMSRRNSAAGIARTRPGSTHAGGQGERVAR